MVPIAIRLSFVLVVCLSTLATVHCASLVTVNDFKKSADGAGKSVSSGVSPVSDVSKQTKPIMKTVSDTQSRAQSQIKSATGNVGKLPSVSSYSDVSKQTKPIMKTVSDTQSRAQSQIQSATGNVGKVPSVSSYSDVSKQTKPMMKTVSDTQTQAQNQMQSATNNVGKLSSQTQKQVQSQSQLSSNIMKSGSGLTSGLSSSSYSSMVPIGGVSSMMKSGNSIIPTSLLESLSGPFNNLDIQKIIKQSTNTIKIPSV